MNKLQYENLELYEEYLEEHLIATQPHMIKTYDISSYSTGSTYQDDIWFMDLYYERLNISNSVRKFNFSTIIQLDIRKQVKKFIYVKLINKYSLEELKANLDIIKNFLKYLKCEKIEEIVAIDIENYYNKLHESGISEKTIFKRWNVLKSLFGFSGRNDIMQKMNLYKVVYPKYIKNDNKYIEESVSKSLDFIFKNEDLPLHNKLLYWILRLYPGRCTEVLSTPIDCIKSYQENIYIFSTKVFKTSGGNEEGITKLLYIDTSEEMQAYLYNLIIRQQSIAKEIRSKNPERGDFLFLTYKKSYNTKLKKCTNTNGIMLYKTKYFNIFLKKIIDEYQVVDEKGERADATSHKFRHNGVTDRIESKLFRPIDLRPMTLHANEEMVNKAYYHSTPEQVIKKSQDVREYMTGETVVFAGKVIGSKADAVFERFLRNPFAMSLNHMGICADSRACAKSKLECLGCEYFIPNCDDLEYFEELLVNWEKKYEIANQVNNKYMQENALGNIEMVKKVIEKINNMLNKVDVNDKK